MFRYNKTCRRCKTNNDCFNFCNFIRWIELKCNRCSGEYFCDMEEYLRMCLKEHKDKFNFK